MNLVENPVVPYRDYNTGKVALINFTISMARDLGEHGITVNMVSGGMLQTTDVSTRESVIIVVEKKPFGVI